MWQTFHTACAFAALLSSDPIPQLLLFPPPQINSFTGSFQHEDNPYTKNSSSVSHLLNRDKGSKEKGWRGWKSAFVSLEDCVSRLPAATPLPMLALKRTAPCQPCTNQTLFSWPHKLPGATVKGSRQTDWLHSLSLGHYTALSDHVCPLISLLAFSCSLFLMERPSTFVAFLVNNTSVLWEVEKWQNGWQVRWGEKKPVWNEEDKLPKPVSMRCEKEWMNWQETENRWMERTCGGDQSKERKDKKTKLNAKYEMWVGAV